MKKLFAALAIMLMPMAVTGCATIAAQSGNESIATADERAILTAEIAYGAALDGVLAAYAAGLVSEELDAAMLPKIVAAQAAIEKARALYDANRFGEAAHASNSAILQVATLLQLLIDAGIIS